MKKNNWLYTSLAALALATVGTQSAFAEETQTPPAPQENKEEKTQEQKLTEEKAQLEQDIKEINGELETLAQDENVVKYGELTKQLNPLDQRATTLKNELGLTTDAELADLTATIERIKGELQALKDKQDSQEVKDLVAELDNLSQRISQLQTSLKTENTALATIKQSITSAQEKLATLGQEKKELEDKQSAKKTEKETVEGRITELTAAIEKEGTAGGTRTTSDQTAGLSSSRSWAYNRNGEWMEEVVFSGSDEKILTAESTYVPNDAKLSEYIVKYINELRRLNGLSGTVAVSSRAQALADELVDRQVAYNKNRTVKGLVHRNPYIYEENLMYYSSITAKSDEELAYRLVLDWFADYINLAPLDPVGFYGHRTTLLANVPDFAVSARRSDDGLYYFALNSSAVEYGKLDRFTLKEEVKTENGQTSKHTRLLMNGKPMVFLPRTTFTYVPNAEKLKEELQAEEEKLAGIDKELTTITQQLTDKTTEIDQQDQLLADEQTKQVQKEDDIRDLKRLIETDEKRVEEIQAELKEKGVDTNELNSLQERKDLLEELKMVLDEMAPIKEELATLQSKVDANKQEIDKLEKRREELNKRLREINAILYSLLDPIGLFLPTPFPGNPTPKPTTPQPSPTGGIGSGRPGDQDKETGVAGGGAPKTPLVGSGSSTTSTSGNKTLPNTGDASVLASMGLGLFLSSLGLAVGKRRRNKA